MLLPLFRSYLVQIETASNVLRSTDDVAHAIAHRVREAALKCRRFRTLDRDTLAIEQKFNGRDREGKLIRDAGSVTYNAAIESIATRDTDTARIRAEAPVRLCRDSLFPLDPGRT